MDIAKLKSALAGKSGARLKLWMEICARCGLCAEGCHFFQSDPRPEHVPAYRLKPLAELMRRNGEVDEAFMEQLVDNEREAISRYEEENPVERNDGLQTEFFQ